MKKYFGSIVLSLVFGLFLAKFVLNQYKDFNLMSAFNYSDSLYFLKEGDYDSYDSMKDSMASFSYYIYDFYDNQYHTYVGITKSLENASKIKGFFNNMGYDISVEENNINNSVFVSVVSQYDLLLNDAEGDAILDICNQVLTSYEELVNENKDEGYSKE